MKISKWPKDWRERNIADGLLTWLSEVGIGDDTIVSGGILKCTDRYDWTDIPWIQDDSSGGSVDDQGSVDGQTDELANIGSYPALDMTGDAEWLGLLGDQSFLGPLFDPVTWTYDADQDPDRASYMSMPATPIPEPATLLLFGSGVLVLVGRLKSKRLTRRDASRAER